MATATLRPDGAGWVTQVTTLVGAATHWEAVDEASTDEDTSYVQALESFAVTETDGYTLEALPAGVGTITDVTVTARLKKSNTNTNSAKVGVYHATSGGGGAYWSAVNYLTTTYGDYSQSWATSPYTGVAWTVAEINGLQGAIELKGNPGGGADTAGRCTQVYVVVTYTATTAAFIPKVFVM